MGSTLWSNINTHTHTHTHHTQLFQLPYLWLFALSFLSPQYLPCKQTSSCLSVYQGLSLEAKHSTEALRPAGDPPKWTALARGVGSLLARVACGRRLGQCRWKLYHNWPSPPCLCAAVLKSACGGHRLFLTLISCPPPQS